MLTLIVKHPAPQGTTAGIFILKTIKTTILWITNR